MSTKTVDKLAERFPNVINANAQLELIVLSSDICQPQELINPVCADPDDDKFIACAIASKTKIIVSGDKHLLDVSGYQGIEVLTPRRFLKTSEIEIWVPSASTERPLIVHFTSIID